MVKDLGLTSEIGKSDGDSCCYCAYVLRISSILFPRAAFLLASVPWRWPRNAGQKERGSGDENASRESGFLTAVPAKSEIILRGF